jgi:hypothetical protein
MSLSNPGGLEGPFIFTSASCAIYARIQAAGNNRNDPLKAAIYDSDLG